MPNSKGDASKLTRWKNCAQKLPMMNIYRRTLMKSDDFTKQTRFGCNYEIGSSFKSAGLIIKCVRVERFDRECSPRCAQHCCRLRPTAMAADVWMSCRLCTHVVDQTKRVHCRHVQSVFWSNSVRQISPPNIINTYKNWPHIASTISCEPD